MTLDEGTESSICDLIHKFHINCKTPYTSGEILEYIHNKAGIELKAHQVRKLMKGSCNTSFKRVWNRPFSMNLAKINQARINYSATLATKLDFHTVLCNIDECWINHNTRPNYSWGLRSKTIEWKNISLVGRISWIMAIFSNGAWMTQTALNTIDSIQKTSFWLFYAIGSRSQTCFQNWGLGDFGQLIFSPITPSPEIYGKL